MQVRLSNDLRNRLKWYVFMIGDWCGSEEKEGFA